MIIATVLESCKERADKSNIFLLDNQKHGDCDISPPLRREFKAMWLTCMLESLK